MICVLDSCSILNLLNAFRDDRIFKNIDKVFDKVYVSQYVFDHEIFNKKPLYKNWHDNVHNLYHNAGLEKFKYTENLADVENFVDKFCAKKSIPIKKDGEYYSSLTALQISRFNLTDSDFNSKIHRVLFVTDDAPAKADYEFLFENNQIGSIITSVDLIIMLYIKNVIESITDVKKYISDCITLYKIELIDLDTELKKLAKEYNNLKESQLTTNLIDLLNDNKFDGIASTTKDSMYKDFYRLNPKLKEKVLGLKNLSFKTKIPELIERKENIDKDLIWKI